jgi:hypothetical protein
VVGIRGNLVIRAFYLGRAPLKQARPAFVACMRRLLVSLKRHPGQFSGIPCADGP